MIRGSATEFGPNHCVICRADYTGTECPRCAMRIWKSERVDGCLLIVMMLPFVAVGVLAGGIFSGLRAGFVNGRNLWKESWERFRKPKPGSGLASKLK